MKRNPWRRLLSFPSLLGAGCLIASLVPAPRAADMIPPQQVNVTITGGTDPTKLPLAGGTMTGTLTVQTPAQVVVGTATNGGAYPSSGPFTVQGSNAQGAIATFASKPGTSGTYILVISSVVGGGALSGGVGVVVSSGANVPAQQLAAIIYDSSTGDVVFSGTSSHGEIFLSSNGDTNIEPNNNRHAKITTAGTGNIQLTTAAGGRLTLSVGGAATGGALCLNGSNNLSKCTTQPDASGNCTCP